MNLLNKADICSTSYIYISLICFYYDKVSRNKLVLRYTSIAFILHFPSWFKTLRVKWRNSTPKLIPLQINTILKTQWLNITLLYYNYYLETFNKKKCRKRIWVIFLSLYYSSEIICYLLLKDCPLDECPLAVWCYTMLSEWHIWLFRINALYFAFPWVYYFYILSSTEK